jgi:hypothetical protein
VISREKDCLPSLCCQRGAIIIIIIITTIIIIIIYFISPAIYFIGRGLVWDFNYGRGYWRNLLFIYLFIFAHGMLEVSLYSNHYN